MGEVIHHILKSDKTLIHVDLGLGPPGFFDITKSVVLSWGIIALVLLVSLYLTSNLRIDHISRKQAIVELSVKGLRKVAVNMLGEEGKAYAEYIITVLVFLAICNTSGLLGFTPPTMDLNVTAALAIASICVVEYAGIKKKGTNNWLHSFAEPIPVILPMNILELFIRPLSLCMRLFGNILGATIIMEMIKEVVPLVVPAALSVYFDLFDGLIQAYVFCFLTSLYISEATEEGHRESPEEKAARKAAKRAAREERREERRRKKEAEIKFDSREFYKRILMLPPYNIG